MRQHRLVATRTAVQAAAVLALATLGLTGQAQDRQPRIRNTAAVIYEQEPNNTAANAMPLPAGIRPVVVAHGALDAQGDSDWWTFVACFGCQLYAWVDTGGLMAGTSRDSYLELYAADGTTLIEEDDDDGLGTGGDYTSETGFAALITGRTLDAGRHYLRVRAFSPDQIVSPYRLHVVVAPAGLTGELEPNDTAGTSTELSYLGGLTTNGQLASGADVDYFHVANAASYTMLCAFVDGDPDQNGTSTHVILEIRDSADALLMTINSAPAGAGRTGEGLCFTPTSATHYFRVSSQSGSTGAYRIFAAPGRGASLSRLEFFFRFFQQDLAVWRPSNGTWYSLASIIDWTIQMVVQWGTAGDIPVAADYDGDGLADHAVFRPSTGTWYVRRSTNTGVPLVLAWGQNGDLPRPRDFDGDGLADPAVWRPSTGQWFVLKSRTNYTTSMTVAWGQNGDVPIPNDHDGDGVADFAVWRPSTGAWHRLSSGLGHAPMPAVQFGVSTDVPILFDPGVGFAIPALFRPSNGFWYGPTTQWGQNGDIPVPGNYDADTITDVAVWRPSNGTWYLNRSTGGPIVRTWGTAGDIPIKDSY